MSKDREILDQVLKQTTKLQYQDAMYFPKEYVTLTNSGDYEMKSNLETNRALNPGGIRLARGTGTELMWGWLMREKGVTAEQLLNEEVSPALLQEAADTVVKHLKVDKQGPSFDAPEEEQDPKTWCASLSVFGAQKMREYIAGHQELSHIDSDKAELVLADPKMLAAVYFVFNLSQEDSKSWGSEYLWEAKWRQEHPGQKPEPKADRKAEHAQALNEQQTMAISCCGALSESVNVLKNFQLRVDSLIADGNPPRYQPGSMVALIQEAGQLRFMAAHQKELVAEKKDVRELGDALSTKLSIFKAMYQGTLSGSDYSNEEPYSPAWLAKLDAHVNDNQEKVSLQAFERNAWNSEQLAYATRKIAELEAFDSSFHTREADPAKAAAYRSVMKPALPDKAKFMSAFPKGRNFVDLSFFDERGKRASLGRSLAENPGHLLVAKDNVARKYHPFIIGDDGSLRKAAPETVLANGKTVGETMSAITPAMELSVKDNVSDAEKMHDITVRLKNHLEDMRKNEHWYIRGSDEYKKMMTLMQETIAYGETGKSFAAFHEKLRDLTDLTEKYVTKKRAETDRSALADRRLAGAESLLNDVSKTATDLTRERLGTEEEKFYDIIRSNQGKEACDRLRGRKAEVNELLTSYRQIKQKVLSMMNGGSPTSLSTPETNALTGYYAIVHNAKYGDGSLIDSICEKGLTTALQDETKKTLSWSMESMVHPHLIPGYQNTDTYTETNLDEQLEWFECQRLMSKTTGTESEAFRESTGQITDDERSALHLLVAAGRRELEAADAAGTRLDHPVFDRTDYKVFVAAKSEEARLHHMKSLALEKAQRQMLQSKQPGKNSAVSIRPTDFAKSDEIRSTYDRRISSLVNAPHMVELRAKVEASRTVVVQKREKAAAEKAKNVRARENTAAKNAKQNDGIAPKEP